MDLGLKENTMIKTHVTYGSYENVKGEMYFAPSAVNLNAVVKQLSDYIELIQQNNRRKVFRLNAEAPVWYPTNKACIV